MDSTKKITWIISLPPEERLTAAMMFVIVFLAAGWSLTSYNFGKYRTAKENEIIDILKEKATQTIAANNAIMERQNRRYEVMDSTANAAQAKLTEIDNFLKDKKK